ncbi:hypothetical protein RRF57_012073 [Xylaria bambusicola]|uniref:Fungal specific transcription factor n=1 Tax=Xylaria bambusicola TaxID=326684 RepID=A0AAN7V1B2_9PEZI
MRPSGQVLPLFRRATIYNKSKILSVHPARLVSSITLVAQRHHRLSLQSSLRLSESIQFARKPYSIPSHKQSPPSPTMDASNTKSESNKETQPESQSPANPPSLPALPAAGDGVSTLDVGGTALRLDHLGPLVVNEDGTLSRIANWEKMADIERENTLRILGKRNQMRLAKLRAAQPSNSDNAPKKDTENKKAQSDN